MFTILKDTAYFCGGLIHDIQHKHNLIVISMESAEVAESDLTKDFNLSHQDTLKGMLYLHEVSSVTVDGRLFHQKLHMLGDVGMISCICITRTSVWLSVQWKKLTDKNDLCPEVIFCDVRIRAKKIDWIDEVSPSELIVSRNKALKGMLWGFVAMSIVGIGGFTELYNWSLLNSIGGAYIKHLIIGAAILYFVFLLMRFSKVFKQFIDKRPIVLNVRGLWVCEYGLIEWNNVEVVEEFVVESPLLIGPVRDVSISGIKIRLKDPTILMRKLSWMHKKILMISKRRGQNYHIVLSNLDQDSKEVSRYAQRFMKRSSLSQKVD